MLLGISTRKIQYKLHEYGSPLGLVDHETHAPEGRKGLPYDEKEKP
jgi:hypothetical protein